MTRSVASTRSVATARLPVPNGISFTPQPTRILRLWNAGYMDFGAGVAILTGAEAAQQARYVELQCAQRQGASGLNAAAALAFRTARVGLGGLDGKTVMYDLTGGVPGSNNVVPPGGVDPNLLPVNFFNGSDNTIPDDLFIWNQAAANIGAYYLAYTGGPPALRIWDSRWVNYMVAHYAAVVALAPWMDAIMPDVTGRGFADFATDGTFTHPWHPVLLAQVAVGNGTAWPPYYVPQMAAMLKAMAAGSPGVASFHNGAGDGYNWFASDAPSRLMSADLTGAMVELFLRNQSAGASIWPSETPAGYAPCWQQSADMILDASVRKKVLLISTKLWPGQGATPPVTTSMQWYRFSLGTFLLVNDGSHFFTFRADDTTNGTATTTGASALIAGTGGTNFLLDLGNPPSGGESWITATGVLYPIASVDSATQITLTTVVAAADASAQTNFATTNPMHGRRHQQANQYYATQPSYSTLNSVGATTFTGTQAADASTQYTASHINCTVVSAGTGALGVVTAVPNNHTLTIGAGWVGGTPPPANGTAFTVNFSSGVNPDPVNWLDRILLPNGTSLLGTPTDNYVQPISAQRQTGGGSAYYFRRFTKGLVIVNPTTVDVVALDATAAPISAPAGVYTDIGAELTAGLHPTITSLTIPQHSALILTHP